MDDGSFKILHVSPLDVFAGKYTNDHQNLHFLFPQEYLGFEQDLHTIISKPKKENVKIEQDKVTRELRFPNHYLKN